MLAEKEEITIWDEIKNRITDIKPEEMPIYLIIPIILLAPIGI
jgi:hypothetical protein